MKPGPKKEFEESISFNLSTAMREFLDEEARKLNPKRPNVGRVIRQAVLEYWVLKNQRESE